MPRPDKCNFSKCYHLAAIRTTRQERSASRFATIQFCLRRRSRWSHQTRVKGKAFAEHRDDDRRRCPGDVDGVQVTTTVYRWRQRRPGYGDGVRVMVTMSGLRRRCSGYGDGVQVTATVSGLRQRYPGDGDGVQVTETAAKYRLTTTKSWNVERSSSSNNNFGISSCALTICAPEVRVMLKPDDIVKLARVGSYGDSKSQARR